MIQLLNVSKRFRRAGEAVEALADISLEIPKGALALVCGPSGSGKSTLINLVGGLMRPSEGTITVLDQPVERLSKPECAALRARRIAVVFQMFHLIPYLSALENVLLPTLAAPSQDGQQRASELLSELGMDHRLGHFPDELSVGERQRVAMARALMNQPEVILADEPTGNLDPESAGRVLGALEHAHHSGATVLLVSHHHIEAIHPDVEFQIRNGRLVQ